MQNMPLVYNGCFQLFIPVYISSSFPSVPYPSQPATSTTLNYYKTPSSLSHHTALNRTLLFLLSLCSSSSFRFPLLSLLYSSARCLLSSAPALSPR